VLNHRELSCRESRPNLRCGITLQFEPHIVFADFQMLSFLLHPVACGERLSMQVANVIGCGWALFRVRD
jgi:hypothetical protein